MPGDVQRMRECVIEEAGTGHNCTINSQFPWLIKGFKPEDRPKLRSRADASRRDGMRIQPVLQESWLCLFKRDATTNHQHGQVALQAFSSIGSSRHPY